MKVFFPILFLLGALAGPAQAAQDPLEVLLSLDNLGWKRLDSYGPDNPWDGVPRDLQKFGGVSFLLTAKVQFHGIGDARDNRYYPSHLTGLAVNHRAARLHVLHGANMSDSTGKPVAAIRLNYADGRSHTVLMQYGVHTRDWWKHKDEKDASLSDTNSTVVWTGKSADAEKIGATHRLFKTTFDLPSSQVEVESIDVFSLFSRSAFVLLGLTLDPAGAAPRAAAESADLTKFRDQIVVEVSATGGGLLDGARLKGSAFDERNLSTLLGRMDDAAQEPGLVTVDFPANARTLRLIATARNRGPAAIELKSGPDGKFPRKATVQLAMGRRIAGTVLKPDGKPLAKAKVEIRDRPPGATSTASEIKLDEVTTDSEGIWKAQLVPDSAARLVFRVSHADYWPTVFDVSDSPGRDSVTPGDLFANESKFRVAPKFTISGVVKDPSGQPLPQASISIWSANSSTGSQTDAKGHFNIGQRNTGPVTLIVQHPEYAAFAREFELQDKSLTVDVILQPGEPFLGRILEWQAAPAETKPIRGASVTVSWKQNPRVRWTGVTDAAGLFNWRSAPSGPLQIEVRAGSFLPRTFQAVVRTNVSEFALATTFSAWGTVANAETKEPVPEFSMTLGSRPSLGRVFWRPKPAVLGKDGRFAIEDMTAVGIQDPSRSLVKIEAAGFRPELFRADELGWHSNRIELRPQANARGVVKQPGGQAAAGAWVGVIGEGHVSLSGDRVPRLLGDSAFVLKAGEDGRFEIGPRLSQRIVAVHESGYGETTFSNLMAKGEITLEAWSRVEGTVRTGIKPVAGAQVKLSEAWGEEFLYYTSGFSMKTDPAGGFRMEHVPPGTRWLSRNVTVRENFNIFAYQTPTVAKPGETTKVQLGGIGRPVIGKIVPDDASRKIDWTAGTHTLSILPPLAPAFRTGDEYQAWYASPEAKPVREASRSYPIFFERDGSFRAEDIPAGRYQMSLYFYEPRESAAGTRPMVGYLSHQFDVGPMPGDRSDEPLDLGSLELKTRRAVSSLR